MTRNYKVTYLGKKDKSSVFDKAFDERTLGGLNVWKEGAFHKTFLCEKDERHKTWLICLVHVFDRLTISLIINC